MDTEAPPLRPISSHDPDAKNPGWLRWNASQTSRCFNETVLGKQLIRAEGPASARMRIVPERPRTPIRLATSTVRSRWR